MTKKGCMQASATVNHTNEKKEKKYFFSILFNFRLRLLFFDV